MQCLEISGGGGKCPHGCAPERRNEGGKGGIIPRAPNHYGERRMTAGEPKNKQCHKYFLQCSTFAS